MSESRKPSGQEPLRMSQFFDQLRVSDAYSSNPELEELVRSVRGATSAVTPLDVEVDDAEYKIPVGLRTALLRDRRIHHGRHDSRKEWIEVDWEGDTYKVNRSEKRKYSISKSRKGIFERFKVQSYSPDSRFLDRVFSQDIPEHVMEAMVKGGRRTMVDDDRGVEVTIGDRRYVLYEFDTEYSDGSLDVFDAKTGVVIESYPVYENADLAFMKTILDLVHSEDDKDEVEDAGGGDPFFR